MSGELHDDAIAAAAAKLIWEAPDPGGWDLDSSHQSESVSATQQDVFPAAAKSGFVRAFALYGMPLSHMEQRQTPS